MISPSHLSKVAFIDYYRLLHQLEAKKQLPLENIKQHDDDILTYKEAYETLSFLLESVMDYNAKRSDISIDAFSLITDALYRKNILSKEEIINIQNNLQQIWQKSVNQSEDKNEKK